MSPTTLRPLTILLVEDDADVRRTIERVLRKRGFEVVMPIAPPFGANALRLLETEAIDAVILDLLLADGCLDGFDVARRMRDNPNWRKIPLFLTSGLDEQTIQRRATEYAFEGLRTINVGKPLDTNVLFRGLDAIRGSAPAAPRTGDRRVDTLPVRPKLAGPAAGAAATFGGEDDGAADDGADGKNDGGNT